MPSTPKPKTRELTTKQKKFIKAKAEGLTGVAAAKEAYNLTDDNTATVIASQNLRKLNIQEALNAEFEKQGITLERIVAPINRALEAKKTVILGNGEDAFADVVDDHSVQLKASSMAAQFIGIGKQTVEGGVHFHQHVESKKLAYDD